MQIVDPSFKILTSQETLNEINKNIERAGRICYKSEDKIAEGTAEPFVKMLIDRGHEAMIEHGGLISILFTVDRGVSHELVRHRLASFAQESTRYCNYGSDKFGKNVTFIKPFFFQEFTDKYIVWENACSFCEQSYFTLLEIGATPQEARSVLNNSVKTEIVISANPREWRKIFSLRTPHTAHPQMRQVMIPTMQKMQELVPVTFDNIK